MYVDDVADGYADDDVVIDGVVVKVGVIVEFVVGCRLEPFGTVRFPSVSMPIYSNHSSKFIAVLLAFDSFAQ